MRIDRKERSEMNITVVDLFCSIGGLIKHILEVMK